MKSMQETGSGILLELIKKLTFCLSMDNQPLPPSPQPLTADHVQIDKPIHIHIVQSSINNSLYYFLAYNWGTLPTKWQWCPTVDSTTHNFHKVPPPMGWQ